MISYKSFRVFMFLSLLSQFQVTETDVLQQCHGHGAVKTENIVK